MVNSRDIKIPMPKNKTRQNTLHVSSVIVTGLSRVSPAHKPSFEEQIKNLSVYTVGFYVNNIHAKSKRYETILYEIEECDDSQTFSLV